MQALRCFFWVPRFSTKLLTHFLPLSIAVLMPFMRFAKVFTGYLVPASALGFS